MKYLCTHVKGGVGKTTLAIHIAGLISSQGYDVVFIDADRQLNGYGFFNGSFNLPVNTPQIKIENITVIPLLFNNDKDFAKELQKILKAHPDSHIVMDMAPDPLYNILNIAAYKPDKILIPTLQTDISSAVMLPNALEAIKQASLISKQGNIDVKIIDASTPNTSNINITNTLNQIINNTINYKIHQLDFCDSFSKGVYVDFQYAWQYGNRNLYTQVFHMI